MKICEVANEELRLTPVTGTGTDSRTLGLLILKQFSIGGTLRAAAEAFVSLVGTEHPWTVFSKGDPTMLVLGVCRTLVRVRPITMSEGRWKRLFIVASACLIKLFQSVSIAVNYSPRRVKTNRDGDLQIY